MNVLCVYGADLEAMYTWIMCFAPFGSPFRLLFHVRMGSLGSVCVIDVGDAVELELSDEAILKDTEASFDSSLGLWRVCRDGSDTEFIEDSSYMGGEANAGDLLLDAPVIVCTSEYDVTVLIDG